MTHVLYGVGVLGSSYYRATQEVQVFVKAISRQEQGSFAVGDGVVVVTVFIVVSTMTVVLGIV